MEVEAEPPGGPGFGEVAGFGEPDGRAVIVGFMKLPGAPGVQELTTRVCETWQLVHAVSTQLSILYTVPFTLCLVD